VATQADGRDGERFTCEDLDALADKLAHAEERAAAREAELFAASSATSLRDSSPPPRGRRALAEWDVASRARRGGASRRLGARPTSTTRSSSCSRTRATRSSRSSPPPAASCRTTSRSAPPRGRPRALARHGTEHGGQVDAHAADSRSCVILAQMGAFVPARRARIGVVDRVLTRVGASDNLSRGESTFMVEMKETANVLRSRDAAVARRPRRDRPRDEHLRRPRDRLGRGRALHDVVGCRAMFATHYHELTELAVDRAPTCENWSVSAREHDGDVVFLHKLQRGAASRSYGVACARLAGLPEPVLARARAILSDLEAGAAVPSGRSLASARALASGPPAAQSLRSGACASRSIRQSRRFARWTSTA
jgi:DNA mismatch repair protein MutS